MKLAGIFVAGLIIILGTVTCAGRISLMWLFPMAHSIIWIHRTEYTSEDIFPIYGSYLYFLGIITVLLIISFYTVKHRKNIT